MDSSFITALAGLGLATSVVAIIAGVIKTARWVSDRNDDHTTIEWHRRSLADKVSGTSVKWLEDRLNKKIDAKVSIDDFGITALSHSQRLTRVEQRADVFNSFIEDLGKRLEVVEWWKGAMSTPAQPAPSTSPFPSTSPCPNTGDQQFGNYATNLIAEDKPSEPSPAMEAKAPKKRSTTYDYPRDAIDAG